LERLGKLVKENPLLLGKNLLFEANSGRIRGGLTRFRLEVLLPIKGFVPCGQGEKEELVIQFGSGLLP